MSGADADHPTGDAPAGDHDFVVTGSRTEYTGAILALRVDEVAMPGGATAHREVVEHFGAVAVVARDHRGRIAMIRQYRHPIGRRLLEIPAGLLDSETAERPVDAARRELAEEIDIAADTWHVLADIDSSPGFTDEALRLYVAEDLHQLNTAERHDEEADMVLEWVPLDDAVAAVLTGDIVNASSVAGILALAAADRTGAPLRDVGAPWPDEPRALRDRKGLA